LILLFLREERTQRVWALFVSLATFLVSLGLLVWWQNGQTGMQFVEQRAWIPAFNIQYYLGVDGISLWLVLLTTFLTPLVIFFSWQSIHSRTRSYYFFMLLMETAMLGVFTALDLILFYVFWEASLVPMYFIIGQWGGPRRVYASVKFFLYTLLGSLLFLVALMYLFVQSNGSFEILEWHKLPIPLGAQVWLFLAFLIAFAVKVPMWPVHTWLPDAHVEAPTGGSIVLAAIALKLGPYGFVRFSLPIAPDASHELSGFVIALSLIAIVYIGFVALVQADMKKLVAYSSIAHMGFVTLGFFMFSSMGIEGALVQM